MKKMAKKHRAFRVDQHGRILHHSFAKSMKTMRVHACKDGCEEEIIPKLAKSNVENPEHKRTVMNFREQIGEVVDLNDHRNRKIVDRGGAGDGGEKRLFAF